MNVFIDSIVKIVKSVIFFDNEASHCRAFDGCDNITAIKVPGMAVSRRLPYTDPILVAYASTLTPSAKAYMDKVVKVICPGGDNYDHTSGLDIDRDRSILHDWLVTHAGTNMAVVLDFDRTITQSESFLNATSVVEPKFSGWNGFLPFISSVRPDIDLADITLEGWVEYYMGGVSRMNDIQRMFDMVYDSGAELVILTNNLSMPYNPKLIHDFLLVLSRGRPVRLIAGATYFSKHLALSDVDGFADVCIKTPEIGYVKPVPFVLKAIPSN